MHDIRANQIFRGSSESQCLLITPERHRDEM